ncbi:MAG: hypothetical protein CMO40_00595 [Verrucomicrobiaceae bacterium]|nr:hypothetical protein [Verrucomicrobiaceae bacterium]
MQTQSGPILESHADPLCFQFPRAQPLQTLLLARPPALIEIKWRYRQLFPNSDSEKGSKAFYRQELMRGAIFCGA